MPFSQNSIKPVLYICEAQLEFEAKILQKSLPNARVEVFKNAGHAIFVDDAEQFNKVLIEFSDSLIASSHKTNN